jgi:hypothetical protein
MAMTSEQLRRWLHNELGIACDLIRQDKANGDEASALVHRGEMHAIVRVLRHAVDNEDMVAIFDIVALTIGDADFHISELDEAEQDENRPDDG